MMCSALLCFVAESEFEEGTIVPYSNPPELPDVMKAPDGSATAAD
jgi:hypothetical protein